MVRRQADTTRQRILAIAQRTFAAQGYAATSMADLATELGSSKAALYYHFPSKAEILNALLSKPLDEYEQLAEKAVADAFSAEDLLRALIDMTADSEIVLNMLRNDPSIGSVLRRTYNLRQQPTDKIIKVLAGPHAGRGEFIRGHAAYAVAKQATFALLTEKSSPLTVTDRE